MLLVIFVYIAAILPNVISAIGFFQALAGVSTVALLVLSLVALETDRTGVIPSKMRRYAFPMALVFTVLVLVKALVPQPRDLYVVAGTWIAKEVVVSETSSKMMTNVREWLQNEIKGMKQRKEGDK